MNTTLEKKKKKNTQSPEGKLVTFRFSGIPGFDPWVGKIPWRRKWPPTPVFLLGESNGWRSLVGYSPWGHKESDTTELLNFLSFQV